MMIASGRLDIEREALGAAHRRKQWTRRVILAGLAVVLAVGLWSASTAAEASVLDRCVMRLTAIVLPLHILMFHLGLRPSRSPLFAFGALAVGPWTIYPLGAFTLFAFAVSGLSGSARLWLLAGGIAPLLPILMIVGIGALFALGSLRR